jgi:hypothetical protein
MDLVWCSARPDMEHTHHFPLRRLCVGSRCTGSRRGVVVAGAVDLVQTPESQHGEPHHALQRRQQRVAHAPYQLAPLLPLPACDAGGCCRGSQIVGSKALQGAHRLFDHFHKALRLPRRLLKVDLRALCSLCPPLHAPPQPLFVPERSRHPLCAAAVKALLRKDGSAIAGRWLHWRLCAGVWTGCWTEPCNLLLRVICANLISLRCAAGAGSRLVKRSCKLTAKDKTLVCALVKEPPGEFKLTS